MGLFSKLFNFNKEEEKELNIKKVNQNSGLTYFKEVENVRQNRILIMNNDLTKNSPEIEYAIEGFKKVKTRNNETFYIAQTKTWDNKTKNTIPFQEKKINQIINGGLEIPISNSEGNNIHIPRIHNDSYIDERGIREYFKTKTDYSLPVNIVLTPEQYKKLLKLNEPEDKNLQNKLGLFYFSILDFKTETNKKTKNNTEEFYKIVSENNFNRLTMTEDFEKIYQPKEEKFNLELIKTTTDENGDKVSIFYTDANFSGTDLSSPIYFNHEKQAYYIPNFYFLNNDKEKFIADFNKYNIVIPSLNNPNSIDLTPYTKDLNFENILIQNQDFANNSKLILAQNLVDFNKKISSATINYKTNSKEENNNYKETREKIESLIKVGLIDNRDISFKNNQFVLKENADSFKNIVLIISQLEKTPKLKNEFIKNTNLKFESQNIANNIHNLTPKTEEEKKYDEKMKKEDRKYKPIEVSFYQKAFSIINNKYNLLANEVIKSENLTQKNYSDKFKAKLSIIPEEVKSKILKKLNVAEENKTFISDFEEKIHEKSVFKKLNSIQLKEYSKEILPPLEASLKLIKELEDLNVLRKGFVEVKLQKSGFKNNLIIDSNLSEQESKDLYKLINSRIHNQGRPLNIIHNNHLTPEYTKNLKDTYDFLSNIHFKAKDIKLNLKIKENKFQLMPENFNKSKMFLIFALMEKDLASKNPNFYENKPDLLKAKINEIYNIPEHSKLLNNFFEDYLKEVNSQDFKRMTDFLNKRKFNSDYEKNSFSFSMLKQELNKANEIVNNEVIYLMTKLNNSRIEEIANVNKQELKNIIQNTKKEDFAKYMNFKENKEEEFKKILSFLNEQKLKNYFEVKTENYADFNKIDIKSENSFFINELNNLAKNNENLKMLLSDNTLKRLNDFENNPKKQELLNEDFKTKPLSEEEMDNINNMYKDLMKQNDLLGKTPIFHFNFTESDEILPHENTKNKTKKEFGNRIDEINNNKISSEEDFILSEEAKDTAKKIKKSLTK